MVRVRLAGIWGRALLVNVGFYCSNRADYFNCSNFGKLSANIRRWPSKVYISSKMFSTTLSGRAIELVTSLFGNDKRRMEIACHWHQTSLAGGHSSLLEHIRAGATAILTSDIRFVIRNREVSFFNTGMWIPMEAMTEFEQEIVRDMVNMCEDAFGVNERGVDGKSSYHYGCHFDTRMRKNFDRKNVAFAFFDAILICCLCHGAEGFYTALGYIKVVLLELSAHGKQFIFDMYTTYDTTCFAYLHAVMNELIEWCQRDNTPWLAINKQVQGYLYLLEQKTGVPRLCGPALPRTALTSDCRELVTVGMQQVGLFNKGNTIMNDMLPWEDGIPFI